MRSKGYTLEQLVTENKQELLDDERQLDQLEKRLEHKQAQYEEHQQKQRRRN